MIDEEVEAEGPFVYDVRSGSVEGATPKGQKLTIVMIGCVTAAVARGRGSKDISDVICEWSLMRCFLSSSMAAPYSRASRRRLAMLSTSARG